MNQTNTRQSLKWTVVGLWLAGMLAAQSAPLQVNTLAGFAGQGGLDGTGAGALFNGPQAVAVDTSGNVYVADSANDIIRKITPSGVTTTLAGSLGTAGSSNGVGSAALFNQPSGIAIDGAGFVYVADTGNSTIRKISPAGAVTTLAGSPGVPGTNDSNGGVPHFNQPRGIALDAGTNLYVADYGNHTIRKIAPGGSVSTLAGLAGNPGATNATGSNARFNQPQGVAVDSSNNVFVADTANGAVRKITSAGVVTTVAGAAGSFGSVDGTGTNALFYEPVGIAVDATGNLYVADYFNNNIRKITSGGVTTTLCGLAGTSGSADGANGTARFWGPMGASISTNGTIIVADSGNSTIRAITVAGVVTTLAGSPSAGVMNGPGLLSRFNTPTSLASDGAGNIYVADAQNDVVRKITPAGIVSILAGSAGLPGSADGPGTNALFSGPQGITADAQGNVYVADTANCTIRKISSGGMVSTIAGLAGVNGSADGTGTNAIFNRPEGIVLDGFGNILVADSGNHTIRQITPGGMVTTLAGTVGNSGNADGPNAMARFNWPAGLAVDTGGNIFVADVLNHTIREILSTGTIITIAGLPGISGNADGTNSGALFNEPRGLARDAFGNLYVADSFNHTIRQLAPSGTNWIVTTVAGIADVSGSADGLGSSALLNYPSAIAIGPAGQVLVADSGNNAIRINQAVAPVILVQPQNQTNTVGGFVTFFVRADGTLPFTYAWSYNGGGLGPGTNTLSANQAGTYSVIVSNQAGFAVSSNAMLTLIYPPPTITSITPVTGFTNGGLSVTVVGTGFLNGASLYFGTLPAASVVVANATNITAVTPAAPPGAVNLVVTNADGQSATLVNGFSYVVPTPVFFSTGPGSLQLSNGQFHLVITGLSNQGPVVVLASTNLTQWTPIFTNPSTFTPIQFVDPGASNYPLRFYRAYTPGQ